MARAYVSGDLEVRGVHPGDPYEAMRLMEDSLRLRLPSPTDMLTLVRGLGWERLRPPPPPPQEVLPHWRRNAHRAAAFAAAGPGRHLTTTTTSRTPSTRRCSARR